MISCFLSKDLEPVILSVHSLAAANLGHDILACVMQSASEESPYFAESEGMQGFFARCARSE